MTSSHSKDERDDFKNKICRRQREQRRNIRAQQQELNVVEGYLKNFAADSSRCVCASKCTLHMQLQENSSNPQNPKSKPNQTIPPTAPYSLNACTMTLWCSLRCAFFSVRTNKRCHMANPHYHYPKEKYGKYVGAPRGALHSG